MQSKNLLHVRRAQLTFGLCYIALSAVAACSNGNVNTVPVANPSTGQPISASIVAGTAIVVPPVGGYGVSIVFQAGSTVPSGAAITLQEFLGAPANAPVPQAVRHQTAASPAPAASATVLSSVGFTWNVPAQIIPLLANVPTVWTFSGPAFVPGGSYVAELFDMRTSALVQTTVNITITSGNSVSFLNAAAAALTSDPYLLEIVSGSALGSPSPSPSANASSSASASPTAGASASPSPAASSTGLAPTGEIYVANMAAQGSAGTITVYAASSSGTTNESPLATISGVNTGLSQPDGVAVDGSGKIYVSNYGSVAVAPSVTVYAAGPAGSLNEAPLATISGSGTGLSYPTGVALDAAGHIYVLNTGNNSITMYAANPTGLLNEAPIATISGNSTGLSSPAGMAIDATGRIYVANTGQNTVTVYAANPSGTLNEAPLATIAGSKTTLNMPFGISVDASGRIYVMNPNGSNSTGLTVFAANPSGTLNEAPIAAIANLNSDGVALDANGNIYASVLSTPQGIVAYPPLGSALQASFATISGGNTGLNNPSGLAVH
jgi:sugar lactone lactonase YvrE